MMPSTTLPQIPANLPPAIAEALRKAFLSPKRLAANRANAKKSTGPKTEKGKKSSRLNASRHHITGQVHILPDAERFAARAYIDPIIAQLMPVAAEEAAIARDIATSHWRLNRVRAAEDNLFALRTGTKADSGIAGDNVQIADALHVASAFAEQSKTFECLSGYERRINRSLESNRKQLQHLQTVRKAAEATALEEAMLLRRYTQENNEEYDPEGEAKANGGFLFPIEVLDAAILRAYRLKMARATLDASKLPPPATRNVEQQTAQAA